MCLAPLGGHDGSSFRSEVLGTIVAIASPMPEHIGIDNAACLAVMLQLQTLATQIIADNKMHLDFDDSYIRGLQRKLCKGRLVKAWGLQKMVT